MSAHDEVTAALESLWESSRDELDRRIALVEAATRAVGEGSLEEPQRAEAEEAAHRLAGTLGTLGIADGSIQASELEHLFARGPRRRHAGRMTAAASALRAAFESRSADLNAPRPHSR